LCAARESGLPGSRAPSASQSLTTSTAGWSRAGPEVPRASSAATGARFSGKVRRRLARRGSTCLPRGLRSANPVAATTSAGGLTTLQLTHGPLHRLIAVSVDALRHPRRRERGPEDRLRTHARAWQASTLSLGFGEEEEEEEEAGRARSRVLLSPQLGRPGILVDRAGLPGRGGAGAAGRSRRGGALLAGDREVVDDAWLPARHPYRRGCPVQERWCRSAWPRKNAATSPRVSVLRGRRILWRRIDSWRCRHDQLRRGIFATMSLASFLPRNCLLETTRRCRRPGSASSTPACQRAQRLPPRAACPAPHQTIRALTGRKASGGQLIAIVRS
jgi:hypothetical protein